MRIELSWCISASDLREARCEVCNQRFTRRVVEIHVVSDSDDLHIGECCPDCFQRGHEYVEATVIQNLRRNLMMSEASIRMERRAVSECLADSPTFEEFQLYEAGCGGPRYASREEAEAAYERGEW